MLTIKGYILYLKDVISLSISVLLLFRHYISHKITFGAPSSGGVLCSACGAFIYTFGMVQPRDSNPIPPAPKADALPTGLLRRCNLLTLLCRLRKFRHGGPDNVF